MQCWKCKKTLLLEKISFRGSCPLCGFELHTCRGCRYYEKGKPNDCLVPNTEYVRDREAANFCEEFRAKENSDQNKSNGKQKFNSLFKD